MKLVHIWTMVVLPLWIGSVIGSFWSGRDMLTIIEHAILVGLAANVAGLIWVVGLIVLL